jgi:hypothetical protein
MGQSMQRDRDVDQITERVKERVPDAIVNQLIVSHPGDDDGLWFFQLPGAKYNIQLESSTGTCPFIMEHDGMKKSSDAVLAHSIDDAVDFVANYLNSCRIG